jgi:hypothetical protein
MAPAIKGLSQALFRKGQAIVGRHIKKVNPFVDRPMDRKSAFKRIGSSEYVPKWGCTEPYDRKLQVRPAQFSEFHTISHLAGLDFIFNGLTHRVLASFTRLKFLTDSIRRTKHYTIQLSINERGSNTPLQSSLRFNRLAVPPVFSRTVRGTPDSAPFRWPEIAGIVHVCLCA